MRNHHAGRRRWEQEVAQPWGSATDSVVFAGMRRRKGGSPECAGARQGGREHCGAAGSMDEGGGLRLCREGLEVLLGGGVEKGGYGVTTRGSGTPTEAEEGRSPE